VARRATGCGREGHVENVSALVAYGIGIDGKRQLLAVTIGAEESEDSWSDPLAQLNERGLSGVRLVVADAHAGLAKAVRKHIPEAPQQRCTVHLQRNVLAKAPQRLRSQRRTHAVGAFPDRTSALRLVTAVALQVTAIWSDRRYLDMALINVKEIVVAKPA
jgi:putative transposase